MWSYSEIKAERIDIYYSLSQALDYQLNLIHWSSHGIKFFARILIHVIPKSSYTLFLGWMGLWLSAHESAPS